MTICVGACLGAARQAIAAMLTCVVLSFVASAARATDCLPGLVQIPDQLPGLCRACSAPKVPNADQTKCVCPSPTSNPYGDGKITDGCLFCGLGTIPDAAGTNCVVPKCSPGKHVSISGCPAGQTVCCQACGPGEGWYQQGGPGYGQCEVCTVGQIPNPIQDDFELQPCIPCKGGTVATVQGCLPCTGDKVANSEHSHCRGCFNGHVPNAAHTDCVCPAGTIAAIQYNPVTYAQSSSCVGCPPNTIPNGAQTGCSRCPAGTTAQLGSCVKFQASPKPVLPGTPKKPSPPRSTTGPGLLESTPGLGTQGPGAVGTPLGGPRGGGR